MMDVSSKQAESIQPNSAIAAAYDNNIEDNNIGEVRAVLHGKSQPCPRS